MEPILTIDNLNSFGGNMLRQGDKSQLKYRLRDVGNKNLSISGKSCEIKMYGRNYTTVVYETTTTVSSDNTVSFTIDKVLPKGTFYLEFTVGDYIFPTDHREFFEITPSSKGVDANVIEIVGKDVLIREVKSQVDTELQPLVTYLEASEQAELERVQAENERSAKYESYAQQFNDVITDLSEEKDYHSLPEISAARGGKDTLGQRLDETTTQLAETETEITNVRNLQSYELNSRGRSAKGLLSIVTDDGNIADIDTLLPISISENIPFCTAPTVNGVLNGDQHCNLEQLKELQNVYGWEILSHSYSHARLTEITDSELEVELKGSRDWFNENGLHCESFAVPYGFWDERVKTLARKYYRSMRTSLYGIDNKYIHSINTTPIETHELHGIWIPGTDAIKIDQESGFSNQSLDYFKYYIDKAVANNAWLIISTHSWEIRDRGNSGLLTSIIQYAKTKLEIVTFKQALDKIGNIVEVGDYSKPNREKPHFTIGADGKVHTNLITEVFTGYNKYSPNNVLTDFVENQVTTTLITNSYATENDFPVGKGGTFYTYRLALNSDGAREYNRQEYVTFDNEVYIRRSGSASWGTWEKMGDSDFEILTSNSKLGSTPITDFPYGVSYNNISTSNASDMPEGRGGVLITHVLNQTSGTLGYNWQEYHVYASNNRYKRVCASNGSFGEWLFEGTQWGSSLNRPTNGLYNGKPYFDSALKKPIWYYSGSWYDATGAIV